MANSATLLALALPPPAPVVSGALSVVQADQGFSGHAVMVAGATLNVVHQPHILQASGLTTTIFGALLETQDNQTLVGRGRDEVAATLVIPQDDQALTGRAYLGLSALLNVVQASQTLTGHGVGSGVLQAPQTLLGLMSVNIVGTLARVQADQTLSSGGGPPVHADLARLQDDQTLVGSMGGVIQGSLIALQSDQTFAGVAKMVGGLALRLTQQDQTLAAAANLLPFVELTGDITVTLPIGNTRLTEWQDMTASGILVTGTMAGVLSATAATPLTGNILISAGLASTGMTTTVSTDLPASGFTPSITFNAAVLATTPAVALAGPGISIGVSLAATMDLYSPTSFIIIDCGEI